jgi:hypothetical protein
MWYNVAFKPRNSLLNVWKSDWVAKKNMASVSSVKLWFVLYFMHIHAHQVCKGR